MDVLFSLFFGLALMMSSSCGSHEEESTTEYGENSSEATTEVYFYNETLEYYYVTAKYDSDKNQAAGIGPVSLVLLLGLAVHQIWNR